MFLNSSRCSVGKRKGNQRINLDKKEIEKALFSMALFILDFL